MFGRTFVNAHNFVYIPKPGGRYATYTVQDTVQLEDVLRPARPATRRQNTYPCVVSSPQAKETIRIEPLIGTADVGLYLAQQTICKLGLRYTGHEEVTRQGLAKIYSGVSLRFETDHNGGSCSYTFIQVYELPENQRTVSVADPSANVKRDGILGVPQLGNHVVLSLKGDIFLIDRQICAGTVIGDVFPLLTPYAYGVVSSTPLPSAATLLEPTELPPNVTLAKVLALLPPVRRDIIVAAPSIGPSHKPATIQVSLSQCPTVTEVCQTCARKNSSLRVCKLCVEERRAVRAIYCSKDCQAQDWIARHRADHGNHQHSSSSSRVELDQGSAQESEMNIVLPSNTLQGVSPRE